MKNICRVLFFVLLGLAVSQAQSAIPTTTLSQALGGGRTSDNGSAQKCFVLASLGSGSSTITAGIQGNQSGTYLLVDKELMQVYSVNTSTNQVCVNRGVGGTQQRGHLNGATVFYSQFSTGSTPGATGFIQNDPTGWCTTALLAYNPIYSTASGRFFGCPGAPSSWLVTSDPLNPSWTVSSSAGVVGPNVSIAPVTTSGLAQVTGFDPLAPIYSTTYGGLGIQSSASLGGSPVTLTAAQCGEAFALDAATGVVYILPSTFPTIGCTYDFYVTTSVTSNSHEIETGSASHFFQGTPIYVVAAGGNAATFYCNGTTHIALKTNGTTTGGLQGSHIKVTVISSTVAVLDGTNAGSGTLATACSTTN
jgi:hypothetical protein